MDRRLSLRGAFAERSMLEAATASSLLTEAIDSPADVQSGLGGAIYREPPARTGFGSLLYARIPIR